MFRLDAIWLKAKYEEMSLPYMARYNFDIIHTIATNKDNKSAPFLWQYLLL